MNHDTLRLTAVAVALACATTLAQTPQFKSSVDLVIVDAVVLDAKGDQATSLTAADFQVTAGGRPRKVVSADYVRAADTITRTTASGAAAPAPIPVAVSNQTPHTGRSFVIVADVSNIVPATGHLVLDRIATFVDALGPRDLVGLAVLPGGTPHIDLTADHDRVRDAAKTIAGASTQGTTRDMLPGEAIAIARGDTSTTEDYLNRVGLDPSTPTASCRQAAQGGMLRPSAPGGRTLPLNADISECVKQAGISLDRYRQRSRAVLQQLTALATAMGPVSGPKTLVFVSDGMTIDPQNRDDLQQFARAAEAARVSLYALQPPTTGMDASTSGGPTGASRALNSHEGLDGLASAAVAARGAAFSISGTADNVLQRINRETSGYYLLAFEREATDKDDARVKIDVRVNRAGYDVRARSEVSPKAAAAATLPVTGDVKTAIGRLIRWPVAVGELPMNIDVYVTHRDKASIDGQALIAVDLGAAAELNALGFEITNADGKAVQDGFEATPSTTALSGGRRYFSALTLAPGRYTLKFAAVDHDGRRGSIERRFSVTGDAVTSLRVGELILGETSANGFAPVAKVTGPFVALVDVLPGSQDPGALSAVMSLTDAAGQSLMKSDVPLRPSADGARFSATAGLDTATIPDGDYVMTFQLRRGETMVAERTRQFHKLPNAAKR